MSQIKKTIVILASVLSSLFLPIKMAGEEVFAWRHELNILQDIFSLNFWGIHLFSGYYEVLPVFALLMFFAQIFLCTAIFMQKNTTRTVKIGLLFLWLALVLIFIKNGD